MKKTYMNIAALLLAVAAFGTQAFAAVSSITVKTDKSNISYTYNADENSEAKADAAKLFNNFEEVSQDEYSAENVTITSAGSAGVLIEVLLKLETETVDADISPLDYYSFRITDAEGNTVYDDENADMTDAKASVKSISFGEFNAESDTDTKEFKVEYKINEQVANTVSGEITDAVTVSVASHPVDADNAEYSVSVLAQEYGDELFSEPDEAVLSKVVKPNSVSEEKPEEEVIESAGVTKVCGVDITAGRYLVSGNGIVKVTDKDGKLKGEMTVTDGSVGSVDGVDVCVTTITDGDVITVYPLEGMEKPSIRFEKTNTSVTSAATTGGGSPAPAATAKPVARKVNPKTGDGADNTALYVVMILAAAGAVALEIVKRKSQKSM